MGKSFEINGKEVVWNYECIRDFCPMYSNFKDHNEGLMYFLPEAVEQYAESEDEDVKEIQKYVIYDFDDVDDYDTGMTDYRTDIDCRMVILKALITGEKPTEKELSAILDVIYIDNLPAEVESIAHDMVKTHQ